MLRFKTNHKIKLTAITVNLIYLVKSKQEQQYKKKSYKIYFLLTFS